MKRWKVSGPALFMYVGIAICLVTSSICFYYHYALDNENPVIMWTGVTTFTIMYHLWVRIIIDSISKLFAKYVYHKQWWFKEKKFEKSVYKFLKVKQWKGKTLTYNPESFSLETNSLEEIISTMTKSELDHWLNEIISISTIFFSLIWGKFWIFLITAIVAMIFDGQFIIIQRYNRPRIERILARHKR